MPVKAKPPLFAAEAADANAGNNQLGKCIMNHNKVIVKPQTTPIYANGRVIGHVTGDSFRKIISGSRHILRTPKAICFDRSTLHDAAAAGATHAEIFDSETRTTYTSTFETIHKFSFPVYRGHGDQIGVTLDHWSVNGATPVAERRAAQTNQERENLQMALFSGGA